MQRIGMIIISLVLLAGCGVRPPETASSALSSAAGAVRQQPAATAVPATPSPAPAASDEVIVRLSRSGGFAGLTLSYAIHSDGSIVVETPKPLVREGAAEGGQVLQAAGGASAAQALSTQIVAANIAAVTPGDYSPENACCDRYAYELDVVVNGQHYTYTTLEGAANQPQALSDVIALVQSYVETAQP